MKIAHLILAHTDPEHIYRLVNRLLQFSDVFIHIDRNTDAQWLIDKLSNSNNCYFVNPRLHCNWGAWNAVEAEIALLRMAQNTDDYDRLVFLQGADYPIKTDKEIISFFENNRDVEFIRGCQVTGSKDPYFWPKCRYISLRNNPNCLKKAFNYFNRKLKLRLRSGWIKEDSKKYPVFWGGALWSITGSCGAYILDFYDNHPKFNHWFLYTFAPDELYFVTVVMNSKFRDKTCGCGPEPEMRGTVNWRTLHIWEYLPGKARIYTVDDFDFLAEQQELYVRKVNSQESKELLDKLDALNE
ncbi:MAG: beta-1,6-N-acetylglucosaminyltransferase [Acutalibacteraceae bacterium]